MVGLDAKILKMVKMTIFVVKKKNLWSKMVIYGQKKYKKWSKMVKNGQKRAKIRNYGKDLLNGKSIVLTT